MQHVVFTVWLTGPCMQHQVNSQYRNVLVYVHLCKKITWCMDCMNTSAVCSYGTTKYWRTTLGESHLASHITQWQVTLVLKTVAHACTKQASHHMSLCMMYT
jgi:hypothetical protein